MANIRQTPTIAPRPSITNTDAPPAGSKNLNARILRKREADRKCQRMIREKTKSKIAYLEAMVEEFKQRDTSGQVEILMQQLAEVRLDRDALAKKVQNIESILGDGRKIKTDGEQLQDDSDEFTAPRAAASVQDTESSLDETSGRVLDEKPQSSQRGVRGSHHAHSIENPFSSTLAGTEQFTQLMPAPMVCMDECAVPIYPKPKEMCDCVAPPQTLARARPPFNIWRYANEVLSSRFLWPPYYNTLEDEHADDVPVRVVMEGWEAVERRGRLHPSWQVLKKIDQTIFWRCATTERLAVLYTMHILFESHSDPTPERISRLPSFFWKSSSEGGVQSYAINYFTWPGVRQRFADNQHRYCTNDFWAIFARNLHVLWPYQFRDCYMCNVETGMYSITPQFANRISDLSTWTMGNEIFDRWPEFRSDIRAFDSIPGQISDRSVNVRLIKSSAQSGTSKPQSVSDVDQRTKGNVNGDEHQNDDTDQHGRDMMNAFTLQQSMPAPYHPIMPPLIWPWPETTQTYDYGNYDP